MTRKAGENFTLPLTLQHAFSRMQSDATQADRHLREAWRRPVRHNKALERAALWHAVALSQDCVEMLDSPQVVTLSPKCGVQTRYEIQAGMRTARDVLPFTPLEIAAFRPTEMIRNFRFESLDAEPAPPKHLLDRWHEWVWLDERGVSQRRVEALGESAILAEACSRLSDGLAEILG